MTEAIEVSENLLAAALATNNPSLAGAALLGYGWARRETDPTAAYETLRRALTIADESGDRQQTSIIAGLLTGLAADRGEFTEALDYITQTVRHYYDSGTTELMRVTLGLLAALLARLGIHEPAATVRGFTAAAIGHPSFPEIVAAITHLRDVLGDDRYRSLAQTGAGMTTTEIADFAFEQIARARSELDTAG
ncbi:hypothetical protein NLX62_06590 [Mycobacteriaceae bacterium Msp059]|nr:hypothetical protein [Mycobacteriaceae bacterium Msp059]